MRQAITFSAFKSTVINSFSVVVFMTVYMKDPPYPFESDGSVEREEMEDEAITILNEVNPFQYNSIRLERLLNIQSGSLGASVLAALRRTSFLRYLANGKTQDVCQHLVLTRIRLNSPFFTFENIGGCIFFIAISIFRL
jgi:hypothetical protein